LFASIIGTGAGGAACVDETGDSGAAFASPFSQLGKPIAPAVPAARTPAVIIAATSGLTRGLNVMATPSWEATRKIPPARQDRGGRLGLG
jgi:transcription elongation factor